MRRALPLILLLVVAGGCGSSAARIETPPAPKTTFRGAQVTPPSRAPALALHDARGRPVSLVAQRGRFVLVTFLYTRCPDVCPLIAQNLNATLRGLGQKRADVRVLAVSVDPKGDTPAAVKAYERAHRLLPQFRYLIGSKAELRRVWAAWHVLALDPKAGLVQHVAYTALIDPAGKERVLYDARVQASQVLHDLRLLMSRQPA
jgi:protein SCO1/2